MIIFNTKITIFKIFWKSVFFFVSIGRFFDTLWSSIVAFFTWNWDRIEETKTKHLATNEKRIADKKLLVIENKLSRYEINHRIFFSTYRKENMYTFLFKVEKLDVIELSVNGTYFTIKVSTRDFDKFMSKTKKFKTVDLKDLHDDPENIVAVKKDPNKIIAEVKDLELGFRSASNPNVYNQVIRRASFKLSQGEILGIIGESGSGKSVISSTLYGLTGSTSEIEGGKVIVDGTDVTKFTADAWEKSKLRGKVVSAVFQNPMTTLNPTMKIGKQVAEGILINGLAKNKKDAYNLALDYLKQTRINNAEFVMDMYPHNLSGGMKQRVVIAAIVACQPKLIIFDEPTTALDPTVQAEILEIIKNMVNITGTSAIFITHDLGVVASISNRIAIMYAGQIVETGTTREILYNPRHPYTWGLLASMPDVNLGKRLQTIPGSVPGSLNHITWDAFADRNDYAMGIDFEKEAPTFKISPTHSAKTWLLDKKAPKFEAPDLIKARWEQFKKMKGSK